MRPALRLWLAGLIAALAFAGPAPGAEPRRGGTFIIGIEAEPPMATGHLTRDTPSLMVATMVFSGLVTLDRSLEPKGDLADAWAISADGLTYTFQLNRRALWHDGKPVTAADVEFTFNELIGKHHAGAASWWPNVASVRATGTHSVEFRLKAPFTPFMAILGSPIATGTLVMPKHLYEGKDPKNHPNNQAPIGSGPFRFVKWQKGSHIELARFDRFYRAPRPYLDRVVVQFQPDAASRMLAFERGDVDFLHWFIVPYDRLAQLRKDKRYKVVEGGGSGSAVLEVLLHNVRHPQLKDVRVRQALAHAIDREAIRQKATFGEAKIAHSVLHSGLDWCYEAVFDTYRKPDLARANALLDEAGAKRGADGRRFSLRLAWAAGREYEGRAAEIIRDNLRALGIEVRIEVFDRTTFLDKVFRQWDFDLAHQLFSTGPDPNISVTTRYHSRQIRKVPLVNAMGYSNMELDAILDREYQEPTRGARARAWRRAQQILMQDLPVLPLFEIPAVNLVSAKFDGVFGGAFSVADNRESAHQTR